ncbi:DUF4270 family protein [Chitinophaga deserti]|uniref:DUF4270 family protein n=1 Tax=Chitinophaga deserti TaxID=2164099 RepID=UPI000D6DA30A|nr:DUF4270 family protein [Chitinophaga deserti]
MKWKLIAMAAFTGIAACDKSGFTYEDAAPGGNVHYSLIDTVGIEMRTIQLDSVPASATGYLMIGGYNDPETGRTDVASNFRIARPNSFPELDERAVFDSIELILRPDTYSYGDTLPDQEWTVYQLARPLELDEDQEEFFTHQVYPVLPTPMAREALSILPRSGEKIHLRLRNDFGSTLMEKIRIKSEDVSTDILFLDYMKGLQLKATRGSAIFRIPATDSSVVMRLHYHIATSEIEEHTIDFPLSNPALQYNEVHVDRSNTPLAGLVTGPAGLLSTDAGHRAWMQSITGTVIRLDFPSLPGLKELGKYGRVMQAELVLTPVGGTYPLYALPERVTLCPVDKNQVVLDTLATTSGYQYGNLAIDLLYPEKTRYTYDVTTYCQAMVAAGTADYRGLLVIPSAGDYYSRLNRLVLGNTKYEGYRAYLKIYYLLYQ